MDKRIRRNELCVIGLPRCDFVFSSTRTCFIGYGFSESALEKSILTALLSARGIEPAEAGGSLAPGQNAFCTKICSKIIVSQFCAIILNNDTTGGAEIPNANVNMEYGLMLGFNFLIYQFVVWAGPRVGVSAYVSLFAAGGLTVASNFVLMKHVVFVRTAS